MTSMFENQTGLDFVWNITVSGVYFQKLQKAEDSPDIKSCVCTVHTSLCRIYLVFWALELTGSTSGITRRARALNTSLG